MRICEELRRRTTAPATPNIDNLERSANKRLAEVKDKEVELRAAGRYVFPPFVPIPIDESRMGDPSYQPAQIEGTAYTITKGKDVMMDDTTEV